MNTQTAFVTGATGLLGNNLVRLLLAKGLRVKTLVRSQEKAARQFASLDLEIVVGDMKDVAGFATHLQGTEIVFHTAAHFRDSYKGGDHSAILQDTNVRGTAELLAAAYAAGIRRFVCTSSIATLKGSPDTAIDETMRRDDQDADPYYLSKILADREVDKLLDAHPDMWAAFVLPGWMWGPGDRGPTSAGQILLDFVNRKIPGVPPGSFAIVDARDVAAAMIAAAEKGRRGERYLAAGRAMSIADLFPILERVTGIPAPKKHVPIPLLFALGGVNEIWARITRRPVLLSLASVRLMVSERSSRYDHAKSERELGLHFRPLEETLSDTLNWYRQRRQA